MNRTFEWGVVLAPFFAVFSILPRHCARLTHFLHPKLRTFNAVLITLKLHTLTLWGPRRACGAQDSPCTQPRHDPFGLHAVSFSLRKPLTPRPPPRPLPSPRPRFSQVFLQPLLETAQAMLDVTHAGQVTCSKQVAARLRDPDVRQHLPPSTKITEYLKVLPNAPSPQPLYAVADPFLEERLFAKARRVGNEPQLRLSVHWGHQEAHLEERLASIANIDAALARARPRAPRTDPPGEADVTIVFTHVQGALALWDHHVADMTQAMVLYITAVSRASSVAPPSPPPPPASPLPPPGPVLHFPHLLVVSTRRTSRSWERLLAKHCRRRRGRDAKGQKQRL